MKHLKLFEQQVSMDIPIVESSLYRLYEVSSSGDVYKYLEDNNDFGRMLRHSGEYEGLEYFNKNTFEKYKCFLLIPKTQAAEEIGPVFINFETQTYVTPYSSLDIEKFLRLPQNKAILDYFNKLRDGKKIKVLSYDFDMGYLKDRAGLYYMSNLEGSSNFSNDFYFLKGSDDYTYLIFDCWENLIPFYDYEYVDAIQDILMMDYYNIYYNADFRGGDIYIHCDIKEDSYIYKLIINFFENNKYEYDEDEYNKLISNGFDTDSLYKFSKSYNVEELVRLLENSYAITEANARGGLAFEKLTDMLIKHLGGEFIYDKNKIKSLLPDVNWDDMRYKETQYAIRIENDFLDPNFIIQNRLDTLHSEENNILDIFGLELNPYDYLQYDVINYDEGEGLVKVFSNDLDVYATPNCEDFLGYFKEELLHRLP